MTKWFKIFIQFEGDDFEGEIEAETLEEAEEVVRDEALDRLSYGAEEVLPEEITDANTTRSDGEDAAR